MKKIILSLLSIFISAHLTFSQTAVNFTVNDCNGNSTDLFSLLDSGKIVVMTWVMPCGACIGVALDAYTTCKSYATSNPGKIVFYLIDDYGNTSCNTLTDWASTNEVGADACFSNTAISMSDYGSTSMQKTVVLGGSSHSVYYTVNGSINTTSMEDAINTALSTSSIHEKNMGDFKLNVFPNPATGELSISYSLLKSDKVKIEVVNMLGEKITNVENQNETIGQHQLYFDLTGLKAGIYFLQINTRSTTQQVKFIVE